VQPDGTHRYLDAEWDLPDGGLLAVDIDGVYHRDVRVQDRDDRRQNRVVIGGTTVLRYSSNLVRHHPEIVGAQLTAILRRPDADASPGF
jgi:very-short-patch-repair endonuclease